MAFIKVDPSRKSFSVYLDMNKFGSEKNALPMMKLVPMPIWSYNTVTHEWRYTDINYLAIVISAFVKTGNTVTVESQSGVYIHNSTSPNGVLVNGAGSGPSNPDVPPVPKQAAPVIERNKLTCEYLGVFRTVKGAKIAYMMTANTVFGYIGFGVYQTMLSKKEKELDSRTDPNEIVIDLDSPFTILGLPNPADPDEKSAALSLTDKDVKDAWRKMILKVHSDQCPDPRADEMTRHVNEAYNVIKETKMRRVLALTQSSVAASRPTSPRQIVKLRGRGGLPLGYNPAWDKNFYFNLKAFIVDCDYIICSDGLYEVVETRGFSPIVNKEGEVLISEAGTSRWYKTKWERI